MGKEYHLFGLKVWANTSRYGWRAGVLGYVRSSPPTVYFAGGGTNTFTEQIQYTDMRPRLPGDRLNRPGWLNRTNPYETIPG